jgi:hypothetical protein
VYPLIVARQRLGKHVPAANKNCWRHCFLCHLYPIKGRLVISSYQNFLLPIPFNFDTSVVRSAAKHEEPGVRCILLDIQNRNVSRRLLVVTPSWQFIGGGVFRCMRACLRLTWRKGDITRILFWTLSTVWATFNIQFRKMNLSLSSYVREEGGSYSGQ